MMRQHLDLDALLALRDGERAPRGVDEHLRACPVCRKRLLEARLLRLLVKSSREVSSAVREAAGHSAGQHLDELTLAAYHDQTLPEDKVRSVERHLLGCDRCLEDLLALRADLADSTPEPVPAPAFHAAVRALLAGQTRRRVVLGGLAVLLRGLGFDLHYVSTAGRLTSSRAAAVHLPAIHARLGDALGRIIDLRSWPRSEAELRRHPLGSPSEDPALRLRSFQHVARSRAAWETASRRPVSRPGGKDLDDLQKQLAGILKQIGGQESETWGDLGAVQASLQAALDRLQDLTHSLDAAMNAFLREMEEVRRQLRQRERGWREELMALRKGWPYRGAGLSERRSQSDVSAFWEKIADPFDELEEDNRWSGESWTRVERYLKKAVLTVRRFQEELGVGLHMAGRQLGLASERMAIVEPRENESLTAVREALQETLRLLSQYSDMTSSIVGPLWEDLDGALPLPEDRGDARSIEFGGAPHGLAMSASATDLRPQYPSPAEAAEAVAPGLSGALPSGLVAEEVGAVRLWLTPELSPPTVRLRVRVTDRVTGAPESGHRVRLAGPGQDALTMETDNQGEALFLLPSGLARLSLAEAPEAELLVLVVPDTEGV